MAKRQAIGIDLGGTNLRAALVEIDGDADDDKATLLRQVRKRVGETRHPEAVARALAELIASLEAPGRPVVGAGVAAMLRGTEGFVANSPNLGWREVPFGEIAAAQIGQPVWIENDLSAITWGEYRFGAARAKQNVLCVFVGTGVGGGAIVGGQLYRGASNAAIEIGHTKVVDQGGRPCNCGLSGCLEAYVGGVYVAEIARAEIARGEGSSRLLQLVDGKPDALHAGVVDQAAREGDAQAARIIERGARFLGSTLANAATLLNPQCLLMGGTVWTGSPRLKELALEHFHRLANPPALEALEVIDAVLGDDAGVLGAADLALRELEGWPRR